MKKFLIGFMVFTMVLFMFPAFVSANDDSSISINVDGKLSPGEWDDYFWFEDNSAGPGTGYDDDPLPIFKGYITFDSENLYLAFNVEDTTPNTNRDDLYVYIDIPPVGEFNESIDALYWGSTPDKPSFFGEAYLTDADFPWDRNQRENTWGTDYDVKTAITITDTNRCYELKIPLTAIGAKAGDTIGLKIQARDSDYPAFQYVNYYPDMPDGITSVRPSTRVEVSGNFYHYKLAVPEEPEPEEPAPEPEPEEPAPTPTPTPSAAQQEPTDYVEQTLGAGTVTVDASSVAGAYATVAGSGGQTVTIKQVPIDTALEQGFLVEGATKYVDLHLDSAQGIEKIEFTILGVSGIPKYWNGSSWIECSDYTIDAAGNVTVTITDTTIPSLSDLTGTIFTVVPAPKTVRTHEMTCWQVYVNDNNNFEFIFLWEYKNNNWISIYDSQENLVYRKSFPYGSPIVEVDLPDGAYTVKTFHEEGNILQEFTIAK
jgi:hypothetical protein